MAPRRWLLGLLLAHVPFAAHATKPRPGTPTVARGRGLRITLSYPRGSAISSRVQKDELVFAPIKGGIQVDDTRTLRDGKTAPGLRMIIQGDRVTYTHEDFSSSRYRKQFGAAFSLTTRLPASLLGGGDITRMSAAQKIMLGQYLRDEGSFALNRFVNHGVGKP